MHELYFFSDPSKLGKRPNGLRYLCIVGGENSKKKVREFTRCSLSNATALSGEKSLGLGKWHRARKPLTVQAFVSSLLDSLAIQWQKAKSLFPTKVPWGREFGAAPN